MEHFADDHAAVSTRPFCRGREWAIYTFGGSDGSEALSTGEIYDVEASSFVEMTPMPAGARTDGTSATLSDVIHAIGGTGGNGPSASPTDASNVVEAYSTASSQWTTLASLPEVRFGASAAVTGMSTIGSTSMASRFGQSAVCMRMTVATKDGSGRRLRRLSDGVATWGTPALAATWMCASWSRALARCRCATSEIDEQLAEMLDETAVRSVSLPPHGAGVRPGEAALIIFCCSCYGCC